MKTVNYFNHLVAVSFLISVFSCQQPDRKHDSLLTERIQYDVTIKSPDVDYDWWVQNIEGRSREAFVRRVLEAASNGEVQAYNYFNHPLTPEQVRSIGYRRDTLTFQRAYPPYEFFDTIVEEKIEIRDITRFRFLEEWYFNNNTLEIEKKVLGIAPIVRKYDEHGDLRGYMPLFWVYLDDRYPEMISDIVPEL